MADKKNKTTTINNIAQLNLEIDYDKLADAIVRANERAKTRSEGVEVETKPRFFLAVWKIIKGEKSEDGRFLSAPFAVIISVLYRGIAILGLFAIILFCVASVKVLRQASWQGWNIVFNVVCVVIAILISVVVFLYMLMFLGAANDITHEKDKNYVISVFSGLVSVAALVVAIVALYKGV